MESYYLPWDNFLFSAFSLFLLFLNLCFFIFLRLFLITESSSSVTGPCEGSCKGSNMGFTTGAFCGTRNGAQSGMGRFIGMLHVVRVRRGRSGSCLRLRRNI